MKTITRNGEIVLSDGFVDVYGATVMIDDDGDVIVGGACYPRAEIEIDTDDRTLRHVHGGWTITCDHEGDQQ